MPLLCLLHTAQYSAEVGSQLSIVGGGGGGCTQL